MQDLNIWILPPPHVESDKNKQQKISATPKYYKKQQLLKVSFWF